MRSDQAARVRGLAAAAAVAWLLAGCATGTPREEPEPEPVPEDTIGVMDTLPRPLPPDTSVGTPPINPDPAPPVDAPDTLDAPSGDTTMMPPSTPVDTPPAAERRQDDEVSFTEAEYRGWRQYSVQCARCHGQDALPNPVAPDLRQSVSSKGQYGKLEPFVQIVEHGRAGMPAFAELLTREQIEAIHAYLRGRAEGRLPPGRPEAPAG